MIRRNDDVRKESRSIAGGNGEISFRHRLEKDEMFGKCRLCAELTLEPGNSIGLHAHENEVEIFYLLEGELVSVNEDGSEEPFGRGDVMSTGGGGKHSLRNDSNAPATMLAIIAL